MSKQEEALKTIFKHAFSSQEDQNTANLAGHTPSNDIYNGICAMNVWGTLGWHDIRQRYRRSVLGPFWFTISTLIMVVVLGALYSTLLHQEVQNYLPYLALGLVIWQYLSTIVIEGCNTFISATGLIKQIRIPVTIHVCRAVWRNFAILLHSLPVVVALFLFFGKRLDFAFLLVFPALLVLLLHGVWIGTVLGVLCARFRDIPPIVANLVQVAFFFTPVMWSPEILKERAWVATYNPLYHLIEIVRAPITGRPVLWESWGWSVGLLLVGFLAAQCLMQRFRNRIPYWV